MRVPSNSIVPSHSAALVASALQLFNAIPQRQRNHALVALIAAGAVFWVLEAGR